MRIHLQHCDCTLHFSQAESPWTVGPDAPPTCEWMRTAWRLLFEMPQETVPLHQPKEGEWQYGDGSIWRMGPRRMAPLICFQELLLWLDRNGFGMLAGHLEEEVMNRGLQVKPGKNGEPDRFRGQGALG